MPAVPQLLYSPISPVERGGPRRVAFDGTIDRSGLFSRTHLIDFQLGLLEGVHRSDREFT